MDSWLTVVCLTLMAGLAMPVGGALACTRWIANDWLEREFRHTVIAFGGGALLSAVALVLIPEGIEQLSIPVVVLCFAGGGTAFMALDVMLDRWKSPAGQLCAMLSDFLPEAMALGASFATGGEAGLLLAMLMALQNVPEGFNAFYELREGTPLSSRTIIGAFALMALLGPVAGLLGLFWLSSYPAVVGCIMVFAAAGILYLVFQDIAPQAKLERAWAPALGAVAGFLLGLIGQMLVAA